MRLEYIVVVIVPLTITLLLWMKHNDHTTWPRLGQALKELVLDTRPHSVRFMGGKIKYLYTKLKTAFRSAWFPEER